MKKIREVGVVGLALTSIGLFAQAKYTTNYEVQYNVTYSADSLNLEAKTSETVFTYAGAEHGVFISSKIKEMHKKVEAAEQENSLGSKQEVKVHGILRGQTFYKQFFKNRKEDEVITLTSLAGEEVSYKEETMPLSWEITEDTREIMGYQTQKATTSYAGREYEAWFAIEVPIPDGPYVFYGLPGLIVELYDTRKHYVFELAGLQKQEEPIVWEIPDTKVMTKQKFIEAYNKQPKILSTDALLNSVISKYTAISGVSPDMMVVSSIKDASGREISDQEFRRLQKNSLDSKNNPIELE